VGVVWGRGFYNVHRLGMRLVANFLSRLLEDSP
jgi:hypothetical protein